MTYRIAQSEKYVGNDYWNWSAWIEATPEEMNQISLVTWILHPSFSPSRVATEDRTNQFRLDTAGWGTFMLRAELRLKGVPDVKIIRRMLRLNYPSNEEVVSPSSTSQIQTGDSTELPAVNAHTVFLSYASEDEQQAQIVGHAMKKMGVRVLKANSISADLPIEAAIHKMIRESGAVVNIVGSDYASPYVLMESKMALAEGKPIFTFLSEGFNLPAGLPSNAQPLRLTSDSKSLKSQLAGIVGKLNEVD